MNYVVSLFENVDGTLIELSVSSNQQALCSSHVVRWRMTQQAVNDIRNALTHETRYKMSPHTVLKDNTKPNATSSNKKTTDCMTVFCEKIDTKIPDKRITQTT